MLVLTRAEGEKVCFDLPDGQTITVTHAGFNTQGEVKFGIDAPREIELRRAELPKRPH